MSSTTAITRLESLARLSDHPSHLTRSFLSPASRQAADLLLSWMRDLGLQTSHAPDGTLRGILPGSNPSAPPLLLGSHYDTVIDAGKCDGPLGILSALAALESLAQQNITLPFPVHVLAFSDEEGVRFQTTYLGSRSILAPLDEKTLAATDINGITLASALTSEGWHQNATPIHYPPQSTLGYVELHIEQGRVLEQLNQPAATVSTIAGQTRLAINLTGHADHAGTTPMPLRRDALTGAAECILSAESLARSHPPAVITVGKIAIHPGASNSIPQSANFTIDLRHPEDDERHALTTELQERFLTITDQRNLTLDWNLVQESPATPCDSTLTTRLLDSLEAITGFRESLISGAGHDGVALAPAMPIAMLFIRCRDGLSHHPDEYASPEDIEAGIQILTHFLKAFTK
jgi:allantoate deiminase